MPVPQRVSFLVGWARCPPVKGLLRMVQHLSFNELKLLDREFIGWRIMRLIETMVQALSNRHLGDKIKDNADRQLRKLILK
jgi:hypothetical protein